MNTLYQDTRYAIRGLVQSGTVTVTVTVAAVLSLALGARPQDVRGLVLRGGATLVVAGVGIGVVGAMLLTRFMRSLLFGVTPSDPLTYAGTVALLTTVAMIASYLPARRATQVDPASAVRNE